jgi:hypothetical protein
MGQKREGTRDGEAREDKRSVGEEVGRSTYNPRRYIRVADVAVQAHTARTATILPPFSSRGGDAYTQPRRCRRVRMRPSNLSLRLFATLGYTLIVQ